MLKISDYEKRAAVCRQMMGGMRDPKHRAQLEEMAEAWEMLARQRAKKLNLSVRSEAKTQPPLSTGRKP
jgi:hypothetical protein